MNIVSVTQSGKNYLFSVPGGITLHKGDRVLCDTMRGEAEGICATDNFEADEHATNQIITLTGAYKPLKAVVAKSVWVKFDEYLAANNPVHEVNRKAEVGEWVKINATGIIVKIDDVCGSISYPDCRVSHGQHYEPGEYVVLENYQEAAK